MTDKAYILELIETIMASLVVVFVIYMSIAFPEQVLGSSMEPTYYTGERILVERLSKYFKPFARGEVVVLNAPGNDRDDLIKRIVGMPGDIIKVLDCGVYIARDNKRFKLEEDYLAKGTCTQEGPNLKGGRSVRIEEGYYLVMGDNREVSADSRVFGLVPKNRILGRVAFRFWPLNRLGII